MRKITKRDVDSATASGVRDSWIWDAELKGFALRVRPSGRKVYIIEYRPGAGGRGVQKRRFSIGVHGSPWTPETARREARRLLGVVANGGDPAADKSSHKGSPTVEEMAERFLKEHVDAKRKPATAREYRRLLTSFVVPKIGRKRIVDVTRRDMLKIHGDLANTPYQANRVLAVSKILFNFAILAGDPPKAGNPTVGIESFPEKSRERILSPRELAWLGEAMAEAEQQTILVAEYEANAAAARQRLAAARAADARAAVADAQRELTRLRADRPRAAVSAQALLCFKLLFFTGARLSEIQTLRHEWVDFERGEARLADSKTGVKTIHLPAPALEVLAKVPRVFGNPYVVTGERAGKYFIGFGKPWRHIRKAATVKAWAADEHTVASGIVNGLQERLGRAPTFEECNAAAEAAGVELPTALSNLRLHDLRHAFASVAAASGMGLPIIGKMLGHNQASTTQRYAHLAPDPVKAAAASVAGKIAAALAAGTRSVGVVELPQRTTG